MKRISISLLVLASTAFGADQPSPAEQKMREALRNTMLQLRTSETERANLQASQAELQAKNAALTAQVEALTKQLADDKGKAEKTIAEHVDTLAKREGELVQTRESLEKWKASHAKLTELAKATEAARAGFQSKSIVLERRVDDQQRKNDAMYRLGMEILQHYENFGLGTALTAREPFIGITRVKFENLIQDFSDKLTDARIKPEPASAKSPGEVKPQSTQPKPEKTEPAKPAEKRAKQKPATVARPGTIS